jgi:predicted transposase/invertase (TIGR01784 family)
MDEDEDIKAAKEVLKQISQDEREREKARLRDKYVREMNSSRNEGYAEGEAKGRAEGIEEGRAEGEAKGREEGIASEKIKIAKSLLNQKVDLNIISQSTGLTKEEIKKLEIKD